MLPTGEWKARFDPRFSSRGVFYLDDKHMVDVEVMEDAKHPLSLITDNELEAQVKYCFIIYTLITVPKIHLSLVIQFGKIHKYLALPPFNYNTISSSVCR